jgi:arabinosyltransferase
MTPYDDSSGKQKANDRAKSSAALSTVLILGICLGFVVSEKLYLKHEEAKTTPDALASLRSRKLELGAAQQQQKSLSSATAVAMNDPSLFVKGRTPRNELEKSLQRIAPDGEVMIAISNMNLIRSESLVLWLQGAQRISSKNWLVVAIDEELRDYCVENNINHYYRPVKVRKQ